MTRDSLHNFHNSLKVSRKEDSEKKRLDALERKKERKQLEEEEDATIGGGGGGGGGKGASRPAKKMTRKEIEERMKEIKQTMDKGPKDSGAVKVDVLEENVNRLQIDGEEARSVEAAIDILSSPGSAKVDKHPEKRMKAAYEEFESTRLPELKAENPNLRLSQLKQMLRKEWLKSPQNPFNQ